jgi:hypothetical protein
MSVVQKKDTKSEFGKSWSVSLTSQACKRFVGVLSRDVLDFGWPVIALLVSTGISRH